MSKIFELETLKIRMNDADLQALDLYQRIQRALRSLILEGVLASGARLPATRVLSQSLNVSRDTVENAYVQLHRDGYIVRREGSGSYVAENIGPQLRGVTRRPTRAHIRDQKEAKNAPSAVLSRRGRAIFEGGGVFGQRSSKAFATGIPETRTFPLYLWGRLQRQVLKAHRSEVMLYGDPQGVEPLRRAIATYLNLERGAKVSPEQILILSSTRQALFLCAQLLVDAGQPIAMENPGYFGAHNAFLAAEAKIVPIDVDAQGLRVDLLRADPSGARCVYVTPSHQYPTGATLSLERRLELTHWAAEKGGWIIEDDYDSEFHYEGLPTACVQGVDQYRRTLYVGTFAKTLYPGLRMGYIALPEELLASFVRARSVMDGHTPQIPQFTLARFMEEGHYNTHIRAMRKLYARRRQAMLDAIATHLEGIVTAIPPAGGLQVPCLLEPGWSEQDTIRRAAQAGLLLPGLSHLYLGDAQVKRPQGWLLGFSPLTDHEIETAMRSLAGVLRNAS